MIPVGADIQADRPQRRLEVLQTRVFLVRRVLMQALRQCWTRSWGGWGWGREVFGLEMLERTGAALDGVVQAQSQCGASGRHRTGQAGGGEQCALMSLVRKELSSSAVRGRRPCASRKSHADMDRAEWLEAMQSRM